ncbi:hypothetical protein V6Z11_A02G159100 [Gossypium hirsutum]
MVASFSSEPLALDRLMDILLECESQQRSFVSKIPLQSNLVQHSQVFDSVLAPLTGSMSDSRVMGLFSHGGRRAYRAHGRSNYGRLQCQICERLGHLTQMCYYHFDHSIDGPPVNSFSPPALMFSPLSSSYDLPASLHIWSFKRVFLQVGHTILGTQVLVILPDIGLHIWVLRYLLFIMLYVMLA